MGDEILLHAPSIAREVLAELLDVLEDGNIHAHTYVKDHCLMDGIPYDASRSSSCASDYSDALMDIGYLIEKLQDGKNLGEVVRSSSSIITKNAVLRVGASELLDPDVPVEHISKPTEEMPQSVLERGVLHQVVMLLDIFDASLSDRDLMALKALRDQLKKELEAIRRRADQGNEKAKAMLGDAQSALDNAKLRPSDKRYTYGEQAAIAFLRNRIYARILRSYSDDVEMQAAEEKNSAEADTESNAVNETYKTASQ